MYIISTSDGTRIEIESGVYAITNGETSVVADEQGFNNWLRKWGMQAVESDT